MMYGTERQSAGAGTRPACGAGARGGRGSASFQARLALMVLGGLLLTWYFAYHAVYGRYGMLARARLLDQSALLAIEMKELDARRKALEREVRLLAPEAPDPGLVEEIARETLGYVHRGDQILPSR